MPIPSPVKIEPDAYYSEQSAKQLLGISVRALRDACRKGKLRSDATEHRRFFKGIWIVNWIDGTDQAKVSKQT